MNHRTQQLIPKINNIFNPDSIALVGASNDPGKWGYVTLGNIIAGGFKGRIYPVNSREKEIHNLKVYKRVEDIPEIPDLAVIVVPPLGVVPVVRECIDKGIPAGIVITAGFAEIGDRAGNLQLELLETAQSGRMVLVGPNCNGIMSPWEKVHIQFPPFFVPPGEIAVVSQSGNVTDSLARQIMLKGFGCSRCVSAGNEAVLHTEDYFEYLAEDSRTKVILSYVEGFKDGQRFFRVAKEVSRKKPIVMLKVGKTDAGARAAMSHTASIAGDDEIFEAACRQSGVIRARNLDELLDMGLGFLNQPLPEGRRVGIVTAGGGWGVLAADASNELGFEVVSLPEEILEELDGLLPAWWNRGNPVDLVAGAMGDIIFKCVEVLLRFSSVDGILVMGLMTALSGKRDLMSGNGRNPEQREKILTKAVVDVMERFKGLAHTYQKPVVVASEHMLADAVLEARINHALGKSGSICYRTPHQAAAVLGALARYSEYKTLVG